MINKNKDISWNLLRLASVFLIVWLVTDSTKWAIYVMLLQQLSNLFLYRAHEKLWTIFSASKTKSNDEPDLGRFGIRSDLDQETRREAAQTGIDIFYWEKYRELSIGSRLTKTIAEENAREQTIKKFGLHFCLPYQPEGQTAQPYHSYDLSDKWIEREIERQLKPFTQHQTCDLIELRRKIRNRLLLDQYNNFVTLPDTPPLSDEETINVPPKNP